ncbi:MAG: ATP-binding protein [Candidatus Nitrosotenuis sp.]
MQVVFANLILNSIQAVGTKKGKIAIHASKTEKDLLIAVEDDGPGIDPRVLGRIFDPLFTTKQEGTGLGLASVKNIVNQHGGKISASTNPTIFSIKIPLY